MKEVEIEWVDRFEDSKIRRIFTDKERAIPGLRMFGYENTFHAMEALIPHYHKDCFEFSYLVEGNIKFCVEKHSYELSGGDLYITFPNEIHDTQDQAMSLHKMYWFQLDVTAKNFLYLEKNTACLLLEQLTHLDNRVITVKGNVQGKLSEIFSEIEKGGRLNCIQAGLLLGSFLCSVVQSSDSPQAQMTEDIRCAVDYINREICSPLTMEELAQISLLSVSRFKQKFKEQIGISPRSYINFHKIELAKKLLEQNQTVTQTAMKLGFSDSNYFSTVFRRYTSFSPTEYIAQNRLKSQCEK